MQQGSEPNKPAFVLRHAVASDVGLKRAENQDSFKIIHNNQITVFLVADGMGGAQGGKMASEMAVGLFEEAITSVQKISSELLEAIIQGIHQTILEKSLQDPDLNGMGTTLVGLVFDGDKLHYFNVGDSRLYFISGGEIQKLTKDHTVVQELLNSGAISEEQAKNHPVAHMLTRSLGASSELAVDTFEMQQGLKHGDKFILCSDGLHGPVNNNEIQETLENNDLTQAVSILIGLANKRGGKDNVTVLAVEISKADDVATDEKVSGSVAVADSRKANIPFVIVSLAVTLLLLACILFFDRIDLFKSDTKTAASVPATVANIPSPVTQNAPHTASLTKEDEIKDIDRALDAADQSLKQYLDDIKSQIDTLELKRKYFSQEQSAIFKEIYLLESGRVQLEKELDTLRANIRQAESDKLAIMNLRKAENHDAIYMANQLVKIVPQIKERLDSFNQATRNYIRAIEEKKLRDADLLIEQNFQKSLAERNKSLIDLKAAIETSMSEGLRMQEKILQETPDLIKAKQQELKSLDKKIDDLKLFAREIALITDPESKQASIAEIDRQLEDLIKKQSS